MTITMIDPDLERARKLLDKALTDYVRAERHAAGGVAEPLYLAEARWEMVRQARRMLGDDDRPTRVSGGAGTNA